MTTSNATLLFMGLLVLLIAFAFVGYAFGWLLRAKHERAVLRKARQELHNRPLDTTERAAVDLALQHIEQAFEELQAAKRLRLP